MSKCVGFLHLDVGYWTFEVLLPAQPVVHLNYERVGCIGAEQVGDTGPEVEFSAIVVFRPSVLPYEEDRRPW